MFITKIILDGFKSYGRKVELTGFDESFNAITGFNGSGKSNILDAIVFVLGLSKLEMARCHTLTDLIYKNGQTGVTSASVTIEIDNSDDKFKHTEYRGSKKIVVRREVNLKNQSKYFIDGFSVTKEKILDFFQAVSLNIHNPHFLIMQGKLSKLLLQNQQSMVEEAVGVSTYETKKKHNLAKIAKCDKILEENDKLLSESIRPKMKQLEEEQQKLVKFRDIQAKFDRDNKIFTAYCYMNDKHLVDNADRNIAKLEEQINEKEASNTELDEEQRKLIDEIKALQRQLNAEQGGDLKKFEEELVEKRAAKDLSYKRTLIRKIKPLRKGKQDYKNAEDRLKNLRDENAANEASLQKAHSNYEKAAYEKAKRNIEEHTHEAEKLKEKVDAINFDRDRFTELSERVAETKAKIKEEERNLQNLYIPALDFKYHFNRNSLPSGFEKENVYGPACKLFTVRNIEEHSLAVDKVCGGKLYNIVVANDRTAKTLLKDGNIRERRTFLPLNTIRGRDTDRHAFRVAERLVGKGNVHNAINLVNYEQRFEMVMKNIFGDTLVCPNIDMADKVGFNSEVRKRTVTFDGEIVDPAGTMTTGSANRDRSITAIVHQIVMIEAEVERLKIRLQQDQQELAELNNLNAQYTAEFKKYDLKRRFIATLETALSESNHQVILQEIETMENEINKAKEENENLAKERAELENDIQRLKNTIENAGSNRDKAKKDAEKNIQTARKTRDASKVQLEKEEKNFEVLSREIEHNEESLASLTEKLDTIKGNIAAINERIEQFNAQIDEAQKAIEVVEAQFKVCQDRLNAQSGEIKKRQKKVDSLKKTIEDNEAKVKSLKHEIDVVNIGIKTAATNLKNYEKSFPWIAEEKDSFDNPDSEYHILRNNFNAKEFKVKLDQLKKEKDAMSKKVNLKANIMQSEKQKECEELERKRGIIISDRQKLKKYIEKVEKEKDIELRKAYEKINESFGAIFHTFLNYANCKLSPVNRNNIKEGLEIKVCFGNVWKESLSELSGGQRSLVALSLVLSLLRYNPAPLYILDEVDAALDQSHTQNIGIMIRKHFSTSQFIIVSLKDDMFNNANVLYQTKFIDGFSTVTRRSLL
ncbi:Structural maintenance of chromosomes protein 2 [Tyrophagus putrescentiae]|nr:Structural maintenance of chromosomes protein 2 [Tyrophagus putrescentiae]